MHRSEHLSHAIRGLCGATLLVVFLYGSCFGAEVRIKDIAHVQGIRKNQLTGFGLVVGLNKTGGTSPTTRNMALNVEQRLGLRSDPVTRGRLDQDKTRKTDNMSAVMVTANLPSFAKEGSEIDVLVASIDDAKSLQGGMLVVTELTGADGEVYARASGPVSIGGFSFSGDAAAVQTNHPTSGRIPNGATIERETCTELAVNGRVQLDLKNPDFVTADRIAAAINEAFPGAALVIDSASVSVEVPGQFVNRVPVWTSMIGTLTVDPDATARVVINERTGTVIVGENVRISRVLITHSNLTVITTETPEVSQPAPFSQGETVTVPRTQVDVQEDGIPVSEVQPNITVGDLASALNALGVAPRDLSAIFQQLKESGALHAELEFK